MTHEIHKLTGIQQLEAMPKLRAIETAKHTLRILEHALEDFRNHPQAYEILANFGEMQRTRNGFKSIDPRAVIERVKRTHDKVSEFIARATGQP